ncbi:MAG: hypothetical protein OXC31_14930, partial [Spirochaetaceae bacterium]|nr:hypothetical protein [Spirochaetaceae bacterium]
MRDIEAAVRRWHAAGTRFALAFVVATWGSAPRRPGGAMAVTADLQVAGSLSGGCIEGAVIEEAVRLLAGERGPGRLEYGIEDELAWSVGLSCGGKLSVYLTEPGRELWAALLAGLQRQRAGEAVPARRAGPRRDVRTPRSGRSISACAAPPPFSRVSRTAGRCRCRPSRSAAHSSRPGSVRYTDSLPPHDRPTDQASSSSIPYSRRPGP